MSAAGAFANVAEIVTPIADPLLGPENRFLELDGDVLTKVRSTLGAGTAAAAATTAKQVAEAKEFAEDIAEILENSRVETGCPCCSSDAGVAEAVVHITLLGIS